MTRNRSCVVCLSIYAAEHFRLEKILETKNSMHKSVLNIHEVYINSNSLQLRLIRPNTLTKPKMIGLFADCYLKRHVLKIDPSDIWSSLSIFFKVR